MTRPLAATHDSDKSDATLVHAALQGDRSALEQLIRRRQGCVYSLAQRMSSRDLMTLEKRGGHWWLVADHFSPSPG